MEIPEDNMCVACGDYMTFTRNNKNWYCKACDKLYPRVSKAKTQKRSGRPITKWFPQVSGDVEEVKTANGILVKSLKIFKEKNPNTTIIHRLRDQHGIFGYVTNHGIIVARSYIYGNIVSVATRALYSALNFKKPVIMFIESAGKYYSFAPKKVLEHSESFRNIRGGTEMVNFNIRLGRRYEIE